MSSHCQTCSNLGITGSLINGVISSLEICKTLNCKCSQFVPEGRIFEKEKFEQEHAKTLNYLRENNLCFYIHTPIWSDLSIPEVNDEKFIVNKTRGVVQSELYQILDLPAAAVLHIGKGGPGSTIQNVADRLNSMSIEKGKYPGFDKQLLLEISAGQGGQLGDNWDEVRRLFEAVDKPIGLCVDTQHAFASKMTDWDGPESVVKLFDQAEEASGGIQLFHLNDSKTEYGSNIDRHFALGKGYIWKKDQSSLTALLERCKTDNINLVLETGNSQLKDLVYANNLLS